MIKMMTPIFVYFYDGFKRCNLNFNHWYQRFLCFSEILKGSLDMGNQEV
jgi:hypothetical protein